MLRDNLLQTISWVKQSKNDYYVRLNSLYANHIATHLTAVLKTNGLEYLVQKMESMSTNSLMNFILSPYLCNKIRKYASYASSENLNSLVHYVIAKLESESPLEDSEHVNLIESCTGLFLDFGSELANDQLNGSKNGKSFSPPVSFSLKERNELTKKINLTLKTLQSISPVIGQFIRANTSCIIPYKEAINDGYYTSSSDRSAIGRIVLVNPHLPGVSYTLLLNSIIHESIHSFLYKIELEEDFISPLSYSWEKMVLSPWSGNEIRLVTYIHACFIYYSLIKFWELDATQQLFSRHHCEQVLISLIKGYKNGDDQIVIEKYYDHIDRNLADQLGKASNYVQNKYFSSCPI